MTTLCEHAAGNYRIPHDHGFELLDAAAQRGVRLLDEKLYLEVFAVPAHPERGRVKAVSSR